MIDFNKPQRRPHEHDLLIDEARMAASSDWEEEFVADIIEKRDRYGDSFSLNENQLAKLHQIAGEENLSDGFDRG
jgi:hypothetical protein